MEMKKMSNHPEVALTADEYFAYQYENNPYRIEKYGTPVRDKLIAGGVNPDDIFTLCVRPNEKEKTFTLFNDKTTNSLIGYFYINAYTMDMDNITKEIYTVFNIYIQYDDGQYIETNLKVNKEFASFEEAFETAQKYFKGNLKLMIK
jgi:hypothetical protein